MNAFDLDYNLMDPLLIIGDLIHIIALIYLLATIVSVRSASGVSYRTQEMFLVVFLTRFSDIIIIDHPFHL
jgi:ER lumen protein retaining receptor